MKTIQKFTATGVYDYLRMDLVLNEKLTFLYGLNGSGKTTALKLIMALLEPSLEPLARVPFKRLELQGTTHRHGDVTVRATKDKARNLELTCSLVPDDSFSLMLDGVDTDEIDIQSREAHQNPVLTAFSEIATPIFLGIDRRFRTPRMPFHRRRTTSSRQIALEFQRERNLEDPSFDPGLGEVAFVIEDFASQLRRRQSRIDDQFRKQILLDSFAYVAPTTPGFSFEPSEEMFQEFIGKRATIMHTLKSLELASDEFETRSEEFFTTIETVIGTIKRLMGKKDRRGEPSKELSEALTAWFVNQSQVDRIDRLFDLANKYQEKQESVQRRLTDFVELTNRFFTQTGKEVSIDRGGEVRIRMKNKISSLQALSSGERQMFIMLAHLSLNRKLLKDGVFIVDEPELSLHMAWQDMFVEAVEAANPKLQIILATHAPAIIGGRDSLCIPVSSVEDESNDRD